jgi:quinol monooxygenase YgiN
VSVLMTLRVAGDATKVEAAAAQDPALLQGVIERAKGLGVISHHFYGNEGTILVIDEWPSEEAFHTFFDETPEIAQIMQAAGVTSEPEVTFWRKLDTNDDVG